MDDERPLVRNELSGSAQIAVQVGTVQGDVNVHVPAVVKVPAQLPPRIDDLVNQRRVLDALGSGVAGRPELDDPLVKVVKGPRGSGKSAVATYWLHECQGRYPDGQLYANLGAWTDDKVAPVEVLGEFLVALGVNRRDVPADLETRSAEFRSITRGRSLQVFLDDVRAPGHLRHLLPGRGGSIVVATGLGGGFSALRQHHLTVIDIDPLEDDMAVALLEQFVGDRVHADPVARDATISLCAKLPVAVCLVGALLADSPELSLAELVEELTDPEAGITRMAIGDLPSLSTLFDAGYRRLTEAAKAYYRAIGAHPTAGDVSVDVLAAALDTAELRLRATMRELRDLRLVEPVKGRLLVHSLIHEHARQVAALDDDAPAYERDTLRDRITAWYLTGAVTADDRIMPSRPWRRRLFPSLVTDPEHPAARMPGDWLRTERANLRAVVSSAYRHGDLETVVALCVVLWSLYEPGKFYDDLLATNSLGVKAAEQLRADLARSVLLTQIAFAHLGRDEPDLALAAAGVAIDAARLATDIEAEATALEAAGLAEDARGNRERARSLLRHNLELAMEIGDDRRIALARFHLAKVEPAEAARALLDQALAGFRGLDLPDRRNIAKTLLSQGRLLADPEPLRQALDIVRDEPWPYDHGQLLDALGDLETGAAARTRYEQALEIYDEHGFVRAAAMIRQRLHERS